ncbi:tetratricopeptide repeat protein [Actinomadura montaniterrae]|uniref:Tetratricopeptide repeat protein n=1 Tax=Actinomadura montaniterrae TaxID=1803903 RepID=A0A6L3WBT5_9ACTN|nr:tetratricopeptide repeat protein [Actinomadura montaniterrae]
MVALHGLGGAGKTSVAVEYAHRHQHEYGLVWQVEAEEPATLTAQFAQLAALLGARQIADAADPVHQVHAALAARSDRWLLLLDNIPNQRAIREVLPPTGNGDVLATSRSGHWPTEAGMPVPVLRQGDAAGFLLARTEQTDRAAAQELAQELGALPLAMEQAAAYILATGKTLRAYLDLLALHRVTVLSHGDPQGYDARVASTWSVAFDRLEQTTPTAIALLRLLACYAPDAIPLNLLFPTEHASLAAPAGQGGLDAEEATVATQTAALCRPLALDEAVVALGNYSLISPPVDGTVSVHRLVQAVTLDALTPTARAAWRNTAATHLEQAFPDDPTARPHWAACAALLPHARAVLPPDSRGFLAVLDYLCASGDYRTAVSLHHARHRHRVATLGPDHPQTLIAHTNLVFWTGEAGDVVAARDEFAALLPQHERAFGTDHSNTLTARANLARFTGLAGDPSAACDQYAALLPHYERAFGVAHPDTLTARANLAFLTGKAGDAIAARDEFAALLPHYERAFGVAHPETLTIRAHLGQFTMKAGDLSAARDQYAALLQDRERVSGPDHPQTLTARANLAFLTGKAGDPVAACAQFTALLPDLERVYGPDHPHTLGARTQLARWSKPELAS